MSDIYYICRSRDDDSLAVVKNLMDTKEKQATHTVSMEDIIKRVEVRLEAKDKMYGLNGYVFTFASNQEYGGHYRLIYAKNSCAAREAMHAMHGDKWGFQYSLEQWKEYENDPNRLWTMETMLGGPIYCRDIEEADANE